MNKISLGPKRAQQHLFSGWQVVHDVQTQFWNCIRKQR